VLKSVLVGCVHLFCKGAFSFGGGRMISYFTSFKGRPRWVKECGRQRSGTRINEPVFQS